MKSMDRRRFIRNSVAGASLSLFSSRVLADAVRRPGEPEKEGARVIRRRLGKTGIELPVVSMGVMRADNPALVRAALGAGMKHLDTAHGYQEGNNETMLGEVLREYPRESFVISTKIPPGAKETFLAALDVSLKRLRMEYVDILYVHGLTEPADVLSGATLEALESARRSGKARHVGVSTHRNEAEVIRAAVRSGVYEVVLTSVNFKQDHYPDVRKAIAEAAAAGIGVVAMKTMAGAFHDRERTQPVNCRAALKWVLQDENVTTAIPGITTFEQLSENASVNAGIAMTDEEKASLLPGKSEGGLYCPGCAGCSERCSRGLPVPDIMRAYMYAYGYRDARKGRDLLAVLNIPADPCASCRECTVGCPRRFDVRERIKDIARLGSVPEEFLV